jgi:hypothetical protein
MIADNPTIHLEEVTNYDALLEFETAQQSENQLPKIAVLPRRLIFTAIRRGGLAFKILLEKELLVQGVVIPGRWQQNTAGWLYLFKIYPESQGQEKQIARTLAEALKGKNLGKLIIPVCVNRPETIEFWEKSTVAKRLSGEKHTFILTAEANDKSALLFQIDCFEEVTVNAE